MSRVCILYEQNPDPKATTILGVWSDIPLESVDQFGLNRLLEQIESEVGPQGLLCIKSPNNNLRLCILGVCVSTYVGKRLPSLLQFGILIQSLVPKCKVEIIPVRNVLNIEEELRS